jgi:transcription elongation factor GreA
MTVVLSEVATGEKHTYIIVGSQEANILDGKISNESPLGKSLMGKDAGETIKTVAPSGIKEYAIISIQ